MNIRDEQDETQQAEESKKKGMEGKRQERMKIEA